MPDVFSSRVRSKIMSSIRSKNTQPEKKVRSYIHRRGFRFVLHDRRLPGRPDIVLPKYRTVIEVNGCFWHGHMCKNFRFPLSNKKFWENKINGNIKRSGKNSAALKKDGWSVINVWECHVRKGNFNVLDKKLISLKNKN